MEIAVNVVANNTGVSASDVLKEAFKQMQPNGRSILPRAVTIAGCEFPAGCRVHFYSDSNGILKSDSNKKSVRHWNQAIIMLDENGVSRDGSCVRLHPSTRRDENDKPIEETFIPELKLRGRAKLDAQARKPVLTVVR